MLLGKVIEAVGGTIVTQRVDRDLDITYAAAADLMSDVLRLTPPGVLLITGLINPQAIRTAEIAEAAAIIIVRDKAISQDMKEMANEMGIPLVVSPHSMFCICGLLYGLGIKGCLPADMTLCEGNGS